MASGLGPPAPGTGGVVHGKQPKGVTSDMFKPYILGNKQGLFQLFNVMVCAGVGYYMVFIHDFGPKRHVFSWVREFKARKMKEFFRIDPKDKEVLAIKEKLEEKRNPPAAPTDEQDNR